MDEDRRLLIIRSVISIFCIAILIISVTSLYPPVSGKVDVDVPDENDIDWSLEGEKLLIETSLWINNTGYYSLNDISIDLEMEGYNQTFFKRSKNVEDVKSGEHKEIPISIEKKMTDVSGTLDDLIFNRTELVIESKMKASYPLSLVVFDLDYEDIIDWEGFVKEINYDYGEAEVRPQNGGSRAELILPFEVSTYHRLEGTAEVQVSMYNSTDHLYSSYSFDVSLGGYHYGELIFEINEKESESLITRNQLLSFDAQVSFSETDHDFHYQESYHWGAPLADLTADYEKDQGEVRAHLTFDNNSPMNLSLLIEIELYDSGGSQVGYESETTSVSAGDSYEEVFTVSVSENPVRAEARFLDLKTDMQYEEERAI